MNTNLYKQNTTIIIMGLDCIVKIYNGSEYVSDLPLEIVDLFKQNNAVYNIPSFHIGLYHDKHYISFRGKPYNSVVEKLTGYLTTKHGMSLQQKHCRRSARRS